jgi:hypothetical protein
MLSNCCAKAQAHHSKRKNAYERAGVANRIQDPIVDSHSGFLLTSWPPLPTVELVAAGHNSRLQRAALALLLGYA